jgi:hypothetical protein
MSSCTTELMSTGQAARALGVPEYIIGRLARLGRLELRRFGHYYVVDDLAEVRRVLQEHGYLKPAGDAAAADL